MSATAVRPAFTLARYALVLLLIFSISVPVGSRPSVALAASPDIVISQVYGGGGNSGAPLTNDFIELFNRGAASVDLAGWPRASWPTTRSTSTPNSRTGRATTTRSSCCWILRSASSCHSSFAS